jgi:hypothetical protein
MLHTSGSRRSHNHTTIPIKRNTIPLPHRPTPLDASRRTLNHANEPPVVKTPHVTSWTRPRRKSQQKPMGTGLKDHLSALEDRAVLEGHAGGAALEDLAPLVLAGVGYVPVDAAHGAQLAFVAGW